MANARQLPSGSWQTRATKIINGKKVTKSFTVHPKDCRNDSKKAKKTSELLAREWQIETDDVRAYGKKVKYAMLDYINDHSATLSPSTKTDYKGMIPLFEPIADIYVDDIRTADIQPLVNKWSRTLSTKTCKNRISFLFSCLNYADCDRRFKIQFLDSKPKDVQSPDIADVQRLLQNAPESLKPILYLAAVGGLRRGELAALKEKDINRSKRKIFVHADIVRDGDKWVYKSFTKNNLSGSTEYSKFIIDMLPVHEDPEAYVFGLNPSQISGRYNRYCKRIGFDFSIHTLRHFAASFRSDLGIPKKYIEELGRWAPNSPTVSKHYDDTLDSSRKKYTQIANDFVEDNLRY